MNIHLTMAISDYDHVRDLSSGRIGVQGVDLTVLDLPVQDIFQRFAAHQEWHVSEFSFALYTAMRSSGDDRVIAIPVFPSQVFRHSAIYVHADGPRSAAELGGARIGIPEWAQTAGVWARGILADDYGLDLRSVDWVQGGTNQVGRSERVPLSLPDGLTIRTTGDRSLNDLLLAGELDAIITAHAPHAFEAGDPRVRRLFDDPRAEERAFFDKQGFIPIMHLVVVRSDVAAEHPWVLANLQSAFEQARDASLTRLRDTAISRFPLPWIPDQVAELESPDGAWWSYGLEANRPAVERFCGYATDQGVASRPLSADELFAAAASFQARV